MSNIGAKAGINEVFNHKAAADEYLHPPMKRETSLSTGSIFSLKK